MRNLAHALCLVLLQGHAFWCAPAVGQGFTRRYDLVGIGEPQVAFALEVDDNRVLILGASFILLQNNDYYSTVVSAVLNAAGSVDATDSVIVLDHYLYPGNWNSMAKRSGGGFVAGGSTIIEDGTKRFALIKIYPTGLLEFVAEYGTPGEEWIGRQAIECKDGGFLMVGETGEFGVIDGMLIKTDSSGVVEWQRNYGGPLRDYFYSVDTTTTEDVFVAGGRRYVEDNIDWWAMRLTALGDTVWAKTWGSDVHDLIPIITTKSNGNMLFASGWNVSEDDPISRVYLAELDQDNGDIVWEREYGPTLNFTILRVAKEISQGQGHVAAGFAFAENSNFWQGLLLRTADNGDSLWMRRYFYYDSLMTDGMGELNDVVPAPDGGFIACGFTQGAYNGPYPPGYSQDVWVVKVDSLGCIEPGCNIPMGITTQITNLKGALGLAPNPAHGQCTVQVDLPLALRSVQLRLVVVSAQGQLVREQNVAQGSNTLDLSGLAPGLYHLHLANSDTWLAGAKLIIE